jgi:hypothetical protein
VLLCQLRMLARVRLRHGTTHAAAAAASSAAAVANGGFSAAAGIASALRLLITAVCQLQLLLPLVLLRLVAHSRKGAFEARNEV